MRCGWFGLLLVILFAWLGALWLPFAVGFVVYCGLFGLGLGCFDVLILGFVYCWGLVIIRCGCGFGCLWCGWVWVVSCFLLRAGVTVLLVLSTGARVCGCFLVLPDCSGLDCVVMVVYCLAVRVFLWYSFSGVCLDCVIVMVFMFDVLVVLALDDFGLY